MPDTPKPKATTEAATQSDTSQGVGSSQGIQEPATDAANTGKPDVKQAAATESYKAEPLGAEPAQSGQLEDVKSSKPAREATNSAALQTAEADALAARKAAAAARDRADAARAKANAAVKAANPGTQK